MSTDSTESILAYYNEDFLDSDEARPLRILAEYIQPLRAFQREHIHDTIVFFGSARLHEYGQLGHYYKEAQELARLVTEWSLSLPCETRRFIVCTGGGGGIMEAANRGAVEAGGRTIGLNIGLPHESDLGLVSDWRIIGGNKDFFQVTKAMHNGLQGGDDELTESQKKTYLASAKENAQAFAEQYDFVFMHDPQPAAILSIRGKGSARWIWRCHIDTSEPNPDVWAFLRPFLSEYDAAIFTMSEFAPPDMPTPRIEIIPPAIDPASPKNLSLPKDTAKQVLEWLGVRTDRPLVTQISRFDPWKDPLGVIEAYRQVRETVPDLQLVLAGSLALDDPEGWEVYRSIRKNVGNDPSIHIFTNLLGVGNIEVNAFQMRSDVVVQKSIREGFGLVVSETLWKGMPMVAGKAGGIPLQMADGVGGILVDSVDECAAAMHELLADRQRARALGDAGRDRVREHFLIPRLVLNQLQLMRELTNEKPLDREPGWLRKHDPVCGMALGEHPESTVHYRDMEYGFCSTHCRLEFLGAPERYVRRE